MSTPDSPELAAWRRFLTAHARVVDLLDAELQSRQDLPLTWYEVLLHLNEASERRLRMHELADSILLSRSATTRLVDQLEEKGMVERQTCEEDRRGTWVVLTDQGRRVLREAAPVHLAGIERHFTGHLTSEEARVLADVFDRVIEAVERAD